nr:MAG TPA: hypothetical protein [Caudoviricetes sp.]
MSYNTQLAQVRESAEISQSPPSPTLRSWGRGLQPGLHARGRGATVC